MAGYLIKELTRPSLVLFDKRWATEELKKITNNPI